MGTGRAQVEGTRGGEGALKAKDVLVRGEKKEIKRLLWKCVCAFFAPIYSSWNLVYGTSSISFSPRFIGLEKEKKNIGVASKFAPDIARVLSPLIRLCRYVYWKEDERYVLPDNFQCQALR